mgnify:CR=1 FL=1
MLTALFVQDLSRTFPTLGMFEDGGPRPTQLPISTPTQPNAIHPHAVPPPLRIFSSTLPLPGFLRSQLNEVLWVFCLMDDGLPYQQGMSHLAGDPP